jgi:hypothetical protein
MKYRPFAATLILVLCALTVQAQSGRRQVKPPPAAPVPTPTPEPTPIPRKVEKEPDLFFFVGADHRETFSNIPLSYHDAALRGCAERLRSASSASVEVSERSVSRGEAIKKAKSESGAYVILLTLTFDTMARSYDDLILEFVAFAPGTAKVVTYGRSYMNGQRAGPVVVGPPRGTTTGGLFVEERIKHAGEDAAERILKSLHLNVEDAKTPYQQSVSHP